MDNPFQDPIDYLKGERQEISKALASATGDQAKNLSVIQGQFDSAINMLEKVGATGQVDFLPPSPPHLARHARKA